MKESARKSDQFDNGNGSPPDIIRGAIRNDFSEVDAALASGADLINCQTEETGLTALHIAAGNGNSRMVDHLLSKPGISLSIKDKFGRDPLDMAIGIGNKGIIEALSKRLYPKSFGAPDEASSSVPPTKSSEP